MTVLRLVAERSPASLAELQQAAGLHKTVVFRLLRTLEAGGFVEQDPETGRFSVGLSAYQVGQAYANVGPLVRLGVPCLRTLVEGSPHGAYIGVRDGLEMVYVAIVEGRGPLRVYVPSGTRVAAHATAFGKVMLAELPDDEVLALIDAHGLAQLTPRTITDPSALLEHLHEVREHGYGLNYEETYPGIGSVGAVVRDGTGAPVGAASMSYATSLLPQDELPEWIERTMSAAAEISSRLEGIVVHDAPASA